MKERPGADTMHARVFDTIIRTTFEANALNALAGIVALMTLRLVDSLVDRIVSSRWRSMVCGSCRIGHDEETVRAEGIEADDMISVLIVDEDAYATRRL